MIVIHFAEPLPELVLSGVKDVTWKVDVIKEHNINVGEELSLCRVDESEFGRAIVVSVRETTFGELTGEDKRGHEKFSSDKEMYDTYTGYYKVPIAPETRLKVIRFRLIK